MKVKVRFLSNYRELTGVSEILLELPEGASVGSFLEEICRSFPRLTEHRDEMLISVNRKQAKQAQQLLEGDEAVLLPPAVGG